MEAELLAFMKSRISHLGDCQEPWAKGFQWSKQDESTTLRRGDWGPWLQCSYSFFGIWWCGRTFAPTQSYGHTPLLGAPSSCACDLSIQPSVIVQAVRCSLRIVGWEGVTRGSFHGPSMPSNAKMKRGISHIFSKGLKQNIGSWNCPPSNSPKLFETIWNLHTVHVYAINMHMYSVCVYVSMSMILCMHECINLCMYERMHSCMYVAVDLLFGAEIPILPDIKGCVRKTVLNSMFIFRRANVGHQYLLWRLSHYLPDYMIALQTCW